MREKELQGSIIDMAHRFRWRVAHFRTAMNSKGVYMTPVAADAKGFPDLCMVRDRVVFAEIKVGYNKPTVEQEDWALALMRAGCDVYLWREKDWADGSIEDVLR